MKIITTYLINYRKPYATEYKICKLHKCKDKKLVRWFIDDGKKIEATNADFAQTLLNFKI